MRGERESHFITAGLEHAVRVPSRRRQPRPARCSCVTIRGQNRERCVGEGGRVRERRRGRRLPLFCLAAVERLQPPRLVSVAAKLQPPPTLLGVTVIVE
ncbi:hypothetical protein S83_003453 [Arachis hypogaea]